MRKIRKQGFWSPFLQTMVDNQLNECEIDRFSRWVEAVPSKDQSAATVITFLTREVTPRFGIPTEISSDNGSAFIQKTVKQVIQQLHIR